MGLDPLNLRRALGSLLPGARERRLQVDAYAEAWRLGNDEVATDSGPLWVVLGDSTAQGIGASAPDAGYVGQVRAWLERRDGSGWRVLNLSATGALAADVVSIQLPLLSTIDGPALVSCAVGANDLVRRSRTLEASLATIAAALPPGSLMANLPRGLREGRAEQVNRSIAELAGRHDLRLVDLWAATGPPWRGKFFADGFHPNDTGYRDWAGAFIAAIEED